MVFKDHKFISIAASNCAFSFVCVVGPNGKLLRATMMTCYILVLKHEWWAADPWGWNFCWCLYCVQL